MTLSDRLADAARMRDGAPRPPAPTPEEVRQPAAPNPPGTTRIVAAASRPAMAVTPDPATEPASVCPTCGRTGVLGVVDLHGRTADWSCLTCGTLWQVTLAPAPPPA